MTSPGMIDQAVLQNLSNLAALCFQKAGVEALTNVPLVLCKSGEIQDHASAKALILPTNKPVSDTITSTWSFPFGRTHLQVYDALPCPDGWTPLPNEKNPAWYRSPGGSLMASWNLWGVMIDMFSFGEERRNKLRDQHGRFPIEASPRYGAGLTSVPLVNNALAQIIDAALHLENSSHSLLSGVQDVVLPPAVVLSHDLDNLTGNSLWTQLSRGFRAAKFALKLQPAALHQIGFAVKNLVHPLKHYYFDQFLMWDMQKKRGFRSVAYVLNGRGGRTGARTPFSLSKRLIENAPGFAEIGIHYNYKYSADRRLLDRQKKEINDVLPAPCISGRAHYLCFDPLSEFPTLAQAGILLDESVGWPYDNSYRCGIAGPFAPIEENGMANHNVLELPMTFMDADLPREDGSESTFSAMLDHICEVGGCLTILVHPGACSNPERPDMDGVYQRVLERLVARKARSYLPADLRAMWKVD